VKGRANRIATFLPDPIEQAARRIVRSVRSRPVRMGRLRRLTPLVDNWGLDRGQPVDRYYIESFIRRHRLTIRGVVMEIQCPEYTDRYGDQVERSEIADIDRTNPRATLIVDLGEPNSLPASTYDYVIVTQTLQFVDSLDLAIANLWRSLRPGGALLITVPTVSKVEETLAPTDFWRLTPRGLETILRRQCPDGDIEISGYGNVLVSVSFLHGLVTSDLRRRELDHYDPIFPTGACGRASKPTAS